MADGERPNLRVVKGGDGGEPPKPECRLCGRKGVRGFTKDSKGYRCKGTAACQQRRARAKGRPDRKHRKASDKAAERAYEVLRLKREGWRQDAIAKAVGITPGRVSQILAEHYAQLAEETKGMAEHLRALELDRIDHLYEQLAPFAVRTPLFDPETHLPLTYRDGHAAEGPPSLAAVAELRKLSESRRKLLGLDAPVETKHTGTVRHEHTPVTPDRAARILNVLAEVGGLAVPAGSNN